MNTQNILHDNSDAVPEGLYLKLMNSLKLDFDSEKSKPHQVVIIDRNIPRRILMNKKDLQNMIVEHSRIQEWPDRETILHTLFSHSWWTLRDFCRQRNLPIMKDNPRWIQQTSVVAHLRDGTRRDPMIPSLRQVVDSSQTQFLTVHHVT
jgi:hypothetical protein